MRIRNLLSISLVWLVASSAALAEADPHMSQPAPMPTPSVRAETAEGSVLSGKVVETMNAGGYTYVCLEKSGAKTWVAVPETSVTLGSTMSFQPGQTMMNFESKSLNRVFNAIVFSGGPVASGGSMPAGHPPTGSTLQGPSGSKAQVLEKDATVKVEKAAGKSAYTVAEVYAKRSALNKKTIEVRGKVVKVSKAIMNRNWIHIQDGTGDQKKGTHNLVVTSQDLPSVGEVVTATGTFAKDKDFGAGYLYKAIIEDAKIKK